VISGRRGAPGHLGSLYARLPANQIGIGSYEGVGDDSAPATAALVTPTDPGFVPQVVPAPEPAVNVQPTTTPQGTSRGAALFLVIAFGAAAAYGGYRLTVSMGKGTA
jgi:hypothetical protein